MIEKRTLMVEPYDALARPELIDRLRDVIEEGRPAPREIVQQFYDEWNAGAIDFHRLVRPDVTNHQPDRDPETGLDKFRQAIERVMSAVPDSTWTTLRLLEEGDFVVCHNRWSGTYGGTVFRGVPTPNGKRFSVEHIHVYRISDGRIAEHWVVRDDLAMMQQLGAVPGA